MRPEFMLDKGKERTDVKNRDAKTEVVSGLIPIRMKQNISLDVIKRIDRHALWN
jgi:hypothetical protein